MSEEGYDHFNSFFSAEDSRIYEPLFIAQYLFAPVNTIVMQFLLPWMMKKYESASSKYSLQTWVEDRLRGRKIKAAYFLRYNLLVDLMGIVKKHGRNPHYDFD